MYFPYSSNALIVWQSFCQASDGSSLLAAQNFPQQHQNALIAFLVFIHQFSQPSPNCTPMLAASYKESNVTPCDRWIEHHQNQFRKARHTLSTKKKEPSIIYSWSPSSGVWNISFNIHLCTIFHSCSFTPNQFSRQIRNAVCSLLKSFREATLYAWNTWFPWKYSLIQCPQRFQWL